MANWLDRLSLKTGGETRRGMKLYVGCMVSEVYMYTYPSHEIVRQPDPRELQCIRLCEDVSSRGATQS